MLTQEDIQKLIEANRQVFATKEDLQNLINVFPLKEETPTKDDFEDLRNDFRNLQTAIDGYMTKADKYFQEMLMLAHKVDRLEKWILQLAEKIGVQLTP